MTSVLFIHNNFPAQFVHIARALSNRVDVNLAAIGSPTAQSLPGVKLIKYVISESDVSATHPFARRFDLECRRAEQVLYAASNLVRSGFSPHLILAHPGWGETLPLRAMFPNARIVTYCEFFYRTEGLDFGFDPEFPESGIDGKVRVHLKNAATLLALTECDNAISPTSWQHSTFPREYQSKINILHEGVDTEVAKPDPEASLVLASGRTLTRDDEVITFVSRSFEPLRGFHIFMRALPRIMAERPQAQVVLVGGAGRPYGIFPPADTTWQSTFLEEVAAKIDPARLHFVGHLPHRDYLRALQIASAHVYLTYPFVLSWSLLEAMSAGCLVVASDTAPVREVIDGHNGLLVPFFDSDQLARTLIDVLEHPQSFDKHRKRARATIHDRYDVNRVCLPNMLSFLGLSTTRSAQLEIERA
jgi:glycosyltransferase involved in cell wall biosynthesis